MSRQNLLAIIVIGLLLVSCAPVVGSGLSVLTGLALLLVFVPLGYAKGPPAPPPPCDGYRHYSCNNGRIASSCCPKGAKCNYAYAPYVDCGHKTCVSGKNPGKCPDRHPRTVPAADKAACSSKGGSWQKACIARKVTDACITPMHTNYMGPPLNPPYKTCGDDRCTTNKLRDDCYPTRKEITDKECRGTWRKACIRATVTERCFPDPPTNYSGVFYKSTQYTDCGSGVCAVGTDKSHCR